MSAGHRGATLMLMLKLLADNVKFQNFLFAYDNLKNNLPSTLKDIVFLHIYETKSVNAIRYGIFLQPIC